ncbi:hypothetical protein BX600DRAFT_224681 [Xylariales sp. PMI_506]|nr:hypothetical protein BX600DRAFT_224681 [Xylariales sp. PMI_506]
MGWVKMCPSWMEKAKSRERWKEVGENVTSQTDPGQSRGRAMLGYRAHASPQLDSCRFPVSGSFECCDHTIGTLSRGVTQTRRLRNKVSYGIKGRREAAFMLYKIGSPKEHLQEILSSHSMLASSGIFG